MGNTAYDPVNFDSEIWEERYGRGDAPDEWYPILNWKIAKEMIVRQSPDGCGIGRLLQRPQNGGSAQQQTQKQSLAAMSTAAPARHLTSLQELCSLAEPEFDDTMRRLSLSTCDTDPESGAVERQISEELRSQKTVTERRRFLVIGCGTSALSAELCEEEEICGGVEDVVSVDISAAAIAIASRRYDNRSRRLRFLQMDVLDLSFDSESFDVVVDKATLDCLMCSSRKDQEVPRLVAEVRRVLRPGGEYIIMSTTEPDRCVSIFAEHQWTVAVHTLKVPHPADSVEAANDGSPLPADGEAGDLCWQPAKGVWSTCERIRGRSVTYFVYRCLKKIASEEGEASTGDSG